MQQRRTASLLLTIALLAGMSPLYPVESSAMTRGRAPVVATATRTDDSAKSAKKGGNGFARVLSAPFRAIARLFGSGKSRAPRDAAAEAARPAEASKRAEAAAAVEASRKEEAARRAETERATAAERQRRESEQRTVEQQQQQAARERRRTEEAVRKAEKAARKAALAAQASEAQTSAAQARAVAPVETAAASSNVASATPASVTPQQPTVIWKPYIENVPLDHLSQGRALLEYGYYNEAIAELSIAATTGPDLVEANNLLGQAYDRTGAHRQAQEYYQRALSVAPYNSSVLHNLGYSLYLADDYNAAMKHLRQASHAAPNDARIAGSIALVQIRLRKYNDAFKSLARLEGEYGARVRLAEMLRDANQPDEAIKQYEAALRLQPGSPVILEHLAELYQRTGRTKEAEAARRTLAKPQPNKPLTGGG